MEIDTSRPARKPSERRAIVRYVYETTEAIETDWLEWKSTFDLSRPKYRAATAKHILAFANRHPDRARRNADGLGYLLIGVAPGELPGVPELWDPEKVESWLSPYIGDRVGWEPAYVELDGRHVLFITVEAPQWGDPPFPLRKESIDELDKPLREGWVYIRRPGKSDQVTAAEHDMLVERARQQMTQLKLALEVEGGAVKAIARESLQAEHAKEAIQQERSRLLLGVPETRGLFDLPSPSELRKPEEYRAQVEEYIDLLRQRWSTVVAADVVENERAPLRLRVVNLTDQVFESVQVELRLPLDRSWVYTSGADLKRRLKPPSPPAPWGDMLGDLTRDLDTHLLDQIECEVEGADLLLRYPPLLVRPSTPHRLPTALLALPPELAGQEIPMRWRATSASAPGDANGVTLLRVEPQDEPTPAT